jgi:hypothetical protein
MFDNIAQKTSWNMNSNMTWSYFFIHKDIQMLEVARPLLEMSNYQFVAYLEPSPENDNPVYYLRVDRVETHSVDSLHARNEELAALAHRLGVTYDGMDVGPVGGTPAVTADA